ncbi:MAG: glycoside hydrolase family 28 protein [Bacteroidota bacterium]
MFRKYAIIACIFVFVFSVNARGQKQLKDYLANLSFTMPEMKEPQFPNRTFSIVEYGAIADGHTMNTKPFADAIAACVKAGGGTVLVPPGTWLTGPIKLESNINLHVEKGALVQFSKNIDDYPFIQSPDGRSERYGKTPLISANKASNIAFTGEGVFNGAGEVWRYVLREDLTELQWKALTASGGVVSANGEAWWPSKEAMEGERFLKDIAQLKKELTVADYKKTREYLRPNLVNLIQCNDILFDGPTFENSPRYHILLVQCENLIIRNVKVFAPVSGKNTDAIDPASCRNVVIYNCLIDVGDDGICLKPGAVAESQMPGPACENIVVADCVVYHAHGGFVIGSESYGGVRNVSVRNCVFIGTDVGLRFKSARDRGGIIEKVFFDGIQMREIVTDAILFDMYYSGGAPDVEARKDLTIRKAEVVTNMTPQFKDFYVKNIVCNGADRAVVINGLPEMSIKNMNLENVSITSKRGVYIADADGIQLNGCRIVPQSGAVFNIISSRNVTINGGSYPAAADVFVKVVGETSENIRLIGVDLKQAKKAVELDVNVKVNAVKQE